MEKIMSLKLKRYLPFIIVLLALMGVMAFSMGSLAIVAY
jgi:hypothetical protein